MSMESVLAALFLLSVITALISGIAYLYSLCKHWQSRYRRKKQTLKLCREMGEMNARSLMAEREMFSEALKAMDEGIRQNSNAKMP